MILSKFMNKDILSIIDAQAELTFVLASFPYLLTLCTNDVVR